MLSLVLFWSISEIKVCGESFSIEFYLVRAVSCVVRCWTRHFLGRRWLDACSLLLYARQSWFEIGELLVSFSFYMSVNRLNWFPTFLTSSTSPTFRWVSCTVVRPLRVDPAHPSGKLPRDKPSPSRWLKCFASLTAIPGSAFLARQRFCYTKREDKARSQNDIPDSIFCFVLTWHGSKQAPCLRLLPC